MLSMTKWIYVISHCLGSRQSQGALRAKIKSSCLLVKKRGVLGYPVDSEAVWKRVILEDDRCVDTLRKQEIRDVNQLEAYIQSLEQHRMWQSYRLTYKKVKR